MDYINKIEEIRQYAESVLKKSRYDHSVRVAEMCARICRHYKLDEQKGYLIGIAHDICKYLPDEEMIETAKKDKNPVLPEEMAKPMLLHGRAAAIYLKEKFGIKDKEIIEAVAVHVYGTKDMGDYAKTLFIADKAEPGRPHVSEEYYERLFAMSLNDMLKTVLIENYNYISKKGYEIFPGTQEMIDYFSKG